MGEKRVQFFFGGRKRETPRVRVIAALPPIFKPPSQPFFSCKVLEVRKGRGKGRGGEKKRQQREGRRRKG